MAINKTGAKPLLEVENLKKYFDVSEGFFSNRTLKAVDDVSFHIYRGETLGLVGESGCGKTTAARTVMRLYEPTAGRILFDGQDTADPEALRNFRKKATMVFQDPYSSLNPRMTVTDIIAEPMDIQRTCKNAKERRDRVLELLELVGLNSEHAARYAHEFSGGQRQRIGIARALSLRPDFIACDEPVSALDVSIQAQIINMFEQLRDRFGLTYMFIAHDLLVVRHISNRIAVMYLGRVVELGDADEIYEHPLHPYSQSLISAVPIPDPDTAEQSKRIVLSGDIPSPLDIPAGCPFVTRCPRAKKECHEVTPALKDAGAGHMVACIDV